MKIMPIYGTNPSIWLVVSALLGLFALFQTALKLEKNVHRTLMPRLVPKVSKHLDGTVQTDGNQILTSHHP